MQADSALAGSMVASRFASNDQRSSKNFKTQDFSNAPLNKDKIEKNVLLKNIVK